MLSKSEISVIRTSWSVAAARRDVLAETFYRRLFDAAPQVRPLFKSDITVQGRKLIEMLATIIDTVDEPKILLPILESLAQRHKGYGARPEHYAAVGEVLTWTLNECLGSHFDESARTVWAKAYAHISNHMIDAARRAA